MVSLLLRGALEVLLVVDGVCGKLEVKSGGHDKALWIVIGGSIVYCTKLDPFFVVDAQRNSNLQATYNDYNLAALVTAELFSNRFSITSTSYCS